MYSAIIVATDGSDIATNAVRQAGALAAATGAKLTLVTVTEQAPTFAAAEIGWSVPSTVFDDIRRANVDKSKAILDASARAAGVPAASLHIEDQQPYAGILQAAEQCGADLIVMGSHGHRGLQSLLLGSQATKVVNLAKVSVLVVKS